MKYNSFYFKIPSPIIPVPLSGKESPAIVTEHIISPLPLCPLCLLCVLCGLSHFPLDFL